MWKTRYTYTSNEEEVKMAHRSEQGNVLGFVLVGALLAALLLGGIFVVRHNIANQGGSGADTVANEESDPDTASEGTTGSDSAQPASDKESSPDSSQSLKDTLNAQNSSNREGPATQENTGHDADALPETGPADTAIAVAGATLLVGTSAAYVGSRRLL